MGWYNVVDTGVFIFYFFYTTEFGSVLVVSSTKVPQLTCGVTPSPSSLLSDQIVLNNHPEKKHYTLSVMNSDTNEDSGVVVYGSRIMQEGKLKGFTSVLNRSHT